MDVGLRGNRAARVQISLTLRLTMPSQGSWRHVGQEREFVRRLQVVSGAQVSMSMDNWPERSLKLSGSSNVIFRALAMIVDMLQEDICSTLSLIEGPQPFVTLLLRVPASHCIALLREGGSRVRNICTRTMTQVNVSGNMLFRNSELSITMTGQPHCVSDCVKLICQNLLETLVGTLQERDWTLAYQPSLGPALHADGYNQVTQGSTYTGRRLYARGDPYARALPSTGEDTYTRGDPQDGENPCTRGVPQAREVPCSRSRSPAREEPSTRYCPQAREDPYTRGNPYTREGSYTRGCTVAGEDLYARAPPFAGEGPYTRSCPYTRSHSYAGEGAYTRGCPYAGEDSYARGCPQAGKDPYARGQHQPGSNAHSLPNLPQRPPPQPGPSCRLPTMFPFYVPVVQPAHIMLQSWASPWSAGASEPPVQFMHELIIHNNLIGCVIGLHGANISEIRRKSGAWIKIFPLMEGSSLRLVRIIGTQASIVVAHFMVISSLNNNRS